MFDSMEKKERWALEELYSFLVDVGGGEEEKGTAKLPPLLLFLSESKPREARTRISQSVVTRIQEEKERGKKANRGAKRREGRF